MLKLENELKAEIMRYKKILKAKFKTGGYSPSKHGLEPTTPIKHYLELGTPINKHFGCKTTATTESSQTKSTLSANNSDPSEKENEKQKLMTDEEDDDDLLSAVGSADGDKITFTEAQAILDLKINPGTATPDTNVHKVRSTDVKTLNNSIGNDKQVDMTTLAVGTTEKKIAISAVMNKTPDRPDQNDDPVAVNLNGPNNDKEDNVKIKQFDNVSGSKIDDDRLPFSACRNILKTF